jgi:outer membrane scaffolding protein for murein synthesis (MipA/OmpV family)
MTFSVRATLLALLAPLAATPALAQDKPLWELGLGVGALSLPHYKGSDQQRTWILPVPYVIYRGPILRADRQGARAVLVDGSRLDVDVSIGGSAPTRSKNNEARAGMPDLKSALEVGPNVNWRLASGQTELFGEQGGWRLQLRLPVRAAFTIESNPRYIGWTAAPNLNLDLRTASGWNIGLLAGPNLNSRRYHGYFYDVAPAYATTERPTYSAPGGYAGSRAVMALSRRFDQHWVGAYLQYDNLNGARFEDSPLVRQRQNVSFGIATAWVLKASERRVPERD